MNNPADIEKLSLEQLAEYYVNAAVIVEENTAAKKVIGQEIIDRLKAEKMNGRVIGRYAVSIVTKEICNTTVEEAEPFGAVLVEKKVDTARLRQLKKAGAPVPGFNVRDEIRVKVTDDE